MKIDSKYEKELSKYKDSSERIRYLKQGKETSKIVKIFVENVIITNDFTIENFYALLYIIAYRESVGTETKIEFLKNLQIEHDFIYKIINSINDEIGCWSLPRKRFNELTQSDVSEIWDLIKTIYEEKEQFILLSKINDFAQKEIPFLQSGLLSPIFYCLNPSIFPIINGKSIKLIGKVIKKKISNKLIHYADEREKFVNLRKEFNFDADFRDLDGYVIWFDKKSI